MIQVRLKQLREEYGLSQAALARKLGVAQSTVGMCESGVNKPERDNLELLSDLYGVSIDYILGRENSRNGHVTLPEDEERLLQNYRSLGTEEKNTVQDFIENKKQKPRMYEVSAAASGGGSVTKQLSEEEVEAIRNLIKEMKNG